MLPAAIVGLAVSGAVGAILAVATSELAAIIVDVALLGPLIALVYELIRRFDQRVEAEDHRTALLGALDDSPWLLTEMRDLAVAARSALDDDDNSELFEDLIRDKIKEARRFMQDLERGRVRVPVGDVTPMENQIDRVTGTVRATTIPEIDSSWWLSTAGRDYLERNKRAIEKGAKIQRIVLWDEKDDGKMLAKVIEEQRAAKVDLLFAKRNEITNQRLKTNMAIYDDRTYNEVVFNSEGAGIYIEYYLEPSDAKQAIARFEQLHGLATENLPPALQSLINGSNGASKRLRWRPRQRGR
jgi:hypothetical protein